MCQSKRVFYQVFVLFHLVGSAEIRKWIRLYFIHQSICCRLLCVLTNFQKIFVHKCQTIKNQWNICCLHSDLNFDMRRKFFCLNHQNIIQALSELHPRQVHLLISVGLFQTLFALLPLRFSLVFFFKYSII